MAYIKKTKEQNGSLVGSKTFTTIEHENISGYFEPRTFVEVIRVSEGGYDIKDEEGNIIRNIGWVI